MELLYIFLFLYALINIFALIIYGLTGADLWEFESFKSALFYPKLWQILDDDDINHLGKIIVCTLCLLFTIPAYLVWIIILLLLELLQFLVESFCIIFKKKRK